MLGLLLPPGVGHISFHLSVLLFSSTFLGLQALLGCCLQVGQRTAEERASVQWVDVQAGGTGSQVLLFW